jgi:ribonuclease HI
MWKRAFHFIMSSTSAVSLYPILYRQSQVVYVTSPIPPSSSSSYVLIRYQKQMQARMYRAKRMDCCFDPQIILQFHQRPTTTTTTTTSVEKSPKKRRKPSLTAKEKQQRKQQRLENQKKQQDTKDCYAHLLPNSIRIFTDGSCIKNPGPAGCACRALFPISFLSSSSSTSCSSSSSSSSSSSWTILEHQEAIGRATNNIAELRAIQCGLSMISQYESKYHVQLASATTIYILSDSSYAIGVLSKGWKAQQNVDLIHSIQQTLAEYQSTRRFRILFEYVPGHAGWADNERVDQLAFEMAQQSQKHQDNDDLEADKG